MASTLDCAHCGMELVRIGPAQLICFHCHHSNELQTPIIARRQCYAPDCSRLAAPGRSLCEACEAARAKKD